ncbi:MAG TPA: hypothetical protein VMX33_09320 [bacterium]|nr:hypothetical protein [bacterium]
MAAGTESASKRGAHDSDAENDESINDEIAEFHRERARIRQLMGQIGGVQYSKADTVINVFFIVMVLGFFGIELFFHPLPTTVSIEIGVFLISIKMLWMIHANQKFNHFVFWVLNTVEYRLNANAKALEELTASVDALRGTRTIDKQDARHTKD